MKWTIDECPDANGNTTIRTYDGTPNGDTEAEPIATVYGEHAVLVCCAPRLLEALEAILSLAEQYPGYDVKSEEAISLARAIVMIAKGELFHRDYEENPKS